jgi:hypothetical protein
MIRGRATANPGRRSSGPGHPARPGPGSDPSRGRLTLTSPLCLGAPSGPRRGRTGSGRQRCEPAGAAGGHPAFRHRRASPSAGRAVGVGTRGKRWSAWLHRLMHPGASDGEELRVQAPAADAGGPACDPGNPVGRLTDQAVAPVLAADGQRDGRDNARSSPRRGRVRRSLRLSALARSGVSAGLVLVGPRTPRLSTICTCCPIRTADAGHTAMLSHLAGPSASKQTYC